MRLTYLPDDEAFAMDIGRRSFHGRSLGRLARAALGTLTGRIGRSA